MDYFALFIQILEARGLTDDTIRSYKTYIKAYLNYLASLCILPENASWQMIRDFLAWIQKSRNLDDRTVNAIISHLQFFQIYVLHKEWDRTQVPFRKFDCYLPFVPSREQVCVFINALDDPDARLAAAIIYATGLHIDELCRLKYTDIYRSSHKLYIHHSKNRQDRYVPFTEHIWEMLLNRWVSFPAGTRPHGWIFTRRRDTSQPMYKQWLQREFRACREVLGMDERFCAHSLRHAYATHSYENGLDLLTLKANLGHKSLNSTLIYVHLADDSAKSRATNPFEQIGGEIHGLS